MRVCDQKQKKHKRICIFELFILFWFQKQIATFLSKVSMTTVQLRGIINFRAIVVGSAQKSCIIYTVTTF